MLQLFYMEQEQLKQFLIDSNKAGYAGSNGKKWIKETNGSTTIPFEKGDFKSHDNFFGGEPYGGRVVVLYKNKPVWMMVYYGWVLENISVDKVYAILKKALMQMPTETPFRGPNEFKDNEFTYLNNWAGKIDRYSGEEQIIKNKKLIYKANYMGGYIDKN